MMAFFGLFKENLPFALPISILPSGSKNNFGLHDPRVSLLYSLVHGIANTTSGTKIDESAD